MATFLAAAAIAWFAFVRQAISPWWLLAPGIVFLLLLYRHERVLAARRHADRAAALYQRGMARLDDRWAGTGETGERFLDPAHPYAEDLDLFGKGGLFELLSTARTRVGEETLARWLLAPAERNEALARQEAIHELRMRVDLREDLALLGEDVRSDLNAQALAAWGAQTPLITARAYRIAAAVFSGLAVVSVFISGWFFLAVLILEGIYALRLKTRTAEAIHKVEQPARDLALLAQVLLRLEREQFTVPLLVKLREELNAHGLPPSRQIARLNLLIDLLDSRDHLLLRIIGPPLLWSTQLALAVEAWRARCGPSVGRWLAAVGEMEALCALAGYAYEHPADPFPEFTEQGPGFEAEALGHPLLPESRSVRNDVQLGPGLRLLIVSGSNMSGKSTLLRTVGTNAVLAMAGAPVRARRLRLSPLAVGASIRTIDSLQGGTSRFYAEIKRLRQLLDMTGGPLPLLFLLDELLHGTNSHDRRIGAQAVVQSLVARGAIGLITTHDLALAHIAEALSNQAVNVHFQDHLEDGKITFDYRMRPGVVTKSNALDLMRSVGLTV